eukprot:scaffold173868_cov16-Tisochrysis_lutea.AAC.1
MTTTTTTMMMVMMMIKGDCLLPLHALLFAQALATALRQVNLEHPRATKSLSGILKPLDVLTRNLGALSAQAIRQQQQQQQQAAPGAGEPGAPHVPSTAAQPRTGAAGATPTTERPAAGSAAAAPGAAASTPSAPSTHRHSRQGGRAGGAGAGGAEGAHPPGTAASTPAAGGLGARGAAAGTPSTAGSSERATRLAFAYGAPPPWPSSCEFARSSTRSGGSPHPQALVSTPTCICFHVDVNQSRYENLRVCLPSGLQKCCGRMTVSIFVGPPCGASKRGAPRLGLLMSFDKSMLCPFVVTCVKYNCTMSATGGAGPSTSQPRPETTVHVEETPAGGMQTEAGPAAMQAADLMRGGHRRP